MKMTQSSMNLSQCEMNVQIHAELENRSIFLGGLNMMIRLRKSLVGSFFIYKERINIPQLVGVMMIIASICIVSLFKVQHPHAILSQEEENREMYKLLAILAGLIASFLFGLQIMFIKSLAKFGISGFQAALYYIFFGGVVGVSCLIIALLVDISQFNNVQQRDIGYCVLIGFCICLGQICINTAVQIGNSGISVAIMHTKTIGVTLFSYFIFHQDITSVQFAGILIAFVGAVIIALERKLDCFSQKEQIQ
ncbi:membrane protein [Stylonychia lemnae]|uniref:Membrane protein n=1 Tax=Stylonychia lemnae TaxID=5949 RepID=A0A078BA72_STYLE|nr:membrane protein [Stylonychia lemnae]|eukprot:CDW91314.1 membrane protein [Stylonychia lemnae]